jgi:glucosamine--fructose-6-phosphate aminotransferase (isomerizing)
LFVVVSQSVGSPDLVEGTRAARAAGARTVAIVNIAGSPVANATENVIDLGVGRERSVAATKSAIASMAACAPVADLAGNAALHSVLADLPERLMAAHRLEWSARDADGDLSRD